MKVLIYIEISESTTSTYEKELVSWVKQEFPSVLTFDLDNHSEPALFEYARQVIEKEDSIILTIDNRNNFPAKGMVSLAEKIVKHRDKCEVVLWGNEPVLERMLGLLKDKFTKAVSESEAKEQLGKILGNQ